MDAGFSDPGLLVRVLVQLLLVSGLLRGVGCWDWVGTWTVGGAGFVGTLLGPETTGPASCLVAVPGVPLLGGSWGGCWVWGGGLVFLAWLRLLVYRSILRGGCWCRLLVWCGFVV